MIASLKVLLEDAEKAGASLEDAGVYFEARLRPRFLANILNFFYKPIMIYCYSGKMEDGGKRLVYNSVWTADPQIHAQEEDDLK